MEPFGVLSWAVLDREEEIFECDDIKDEYKVMHALWARWIMLYRYGLLPIYFPLIFANVMTEINSLPIITSEQSRLLMSTGG